MDHQYIDSILGQGMNGIIWGKEKGKIPSI